MTKNVIEKRILLHAPLDRVWRALTDSKEFGTWFGVEFRDPFAPGASVRGIMRPTSVNAEVAKMQKPYEGWPFAITIEKVQPRTIFSFRWHPFAVDKGVDYSGEPTTLVVFTLEEGANGVMLRVTESGFDRIPLARRAKAFEANEQGWGKMIIVIEDYVGRRG
jgi:uncharacterized protein YndB with AHSA1/START domain